MIELDFNSEFEGFEEYEDYYVQIIEVAFKTLNLHFSPIVSVSFVSNEFIHNLNRDYRNIDRPTDVISFAFLDGEENKEKILKSKDVVPLGDIYISIDKAKEQAEEYGHSLKRELSFLFVHGLLHLLGYDHMSKEDEEVMFPLQEKILGQIKGAER